MEIRHGQRNINFPCSADHEQDWQPYPADPYSAICDDHTYVHTYLCCKRFATVGEIFILVIASIDTWYILKRVTCGDDVLCCSYDLPTHPINNKQ